MKRITFTSIVFFLCLSLGTILQRLPKGFLITSEETYRNLIFSETIYQKAIHVLPPTVTIIILFLILFGLTALAIYKCREELELVVPLLLVLLSPTFLYYVINISESVFGIILLGLLWSIQNKRAAYILAVAIGFLHPTVAIPLALYLIALSSFAIYTKRVLRYALVIIGVTSVVGFIQNTFTLVTHKAILQTITSFITEFGNTNGVSLVLIVIAAIGFIAFFPKKQRRFETAILAATLISITTGNTLFFSVSISIVAGRLIGDLLKTTWNIKILKVVSFILLIAVIVNSLALFIGDYVQAEPSREMLDTYACLDTLPKGVILAPQNIQFATMYHTHHEIFAITQEKESIKEQIYFATDFEYTKSLLDRNSIDYILITETLLEDTFQDSKKGLLIAVENEQFDIACAHNTSKVLLVRK